MTWRVVHVSQSEKMRLKLDNLLVQKMGQEFTVPLSDISIIVAEGGDTVVTLRLLSALSKYNIALVFVIMNIYQQEFITHKMGTLERTSA
jgi:cas1_NMENI: CRISPR-associated endonuclease Cas1, NMENI subtype